MINKEEINNVGGGFELITQRARGYNCMGMMIYNSTLYIHK